VFISGPLCSAFSVAYNKMIMFCILSEICINEEASKVAARLKSTQNRSLRRGILKKLNQNYIPLSQRKKKQIGAVDGLNCTQIMAASNPFSKRESEAIKLFETI